MASRRKKTDARETLDAYYKRRGLRDDSRIRIFTAVRMLRDRGASPSRVAKICGCEESLAKAELDDMVKPRERMPPLLIKNGEFYEEAEYQIEVDEDREPAGAPAPERGGEVKRPKGKAKSLASARPRPRPRVISPGSSPNRRRPVAA